MRERLIWFKEIFFSYFSSFYSISRRLTDYTINRLIVD